MTAEQPLALAARKGREIGENRESTYSPLWGEITTTKSERDLWPLDVPGVNALNGQGNTEKLLWGFQLKKGTLNIKYSHSDKGGISFKP